MRRNQSFEKNRSQIATSVSIPSRAEATYDDFEQECMSQGLDDVSFRLIVLADMHRSSLLNGTR